MRERRVQGRLRVRVRRADAFDLDEERAAADDGPREAPVAAEGRPEAPRQPHAGVAELREGPLGQAPRAPRRREQLQRLRLARGPRAGRLSRLLDR